MKSFHELIAQLLLFVFPIYLFGGTPILQETEKKVIAVVDFNNTGQDKSLDYLEKTIPEAIITNLAKNGKLEIVERSRLQSALEEMKLGLTGIVNEQTAVELGRAVGANAILLGSFVSIGGVIRINARLIDVRTSKIITAENVQGKVGREIFDMMDAMALSIEKKLLGESAEKTQQEMVQKIEKQPEAEPVTVVEKEPEFSEKASPGKSPKKPFIKRPLFWGITAGIIVGGVIMLSNAGKSKSKDKSNVNVVVHIP